jgi:hypothetical protein
MKTAGIVADNYKLEKFKTELTSNGFTEFEVSPFTCNTSTIKVKVRDYEIPAIKRICQRVELHFHHSN